MVAPLPRASPTSCPALGGVVVSRFQRSVLTFITYLSSLLTVGSAMKEGSVGQEQKLGPGGPFLPVYLSLPLEEKAATATRRETEERLGWRQLWQVG